MSQSTAVLDINYKTLKTYWDARDGMVRTAEDVQRFDNLVIGMLSTRVSIEEFDAVVQLASQRFHDVTKPDIDVSKDAPTNL